MKTMLISLSLCSGLFLGCSERTVIYRDKPDTMFLKDSSGNIYLAEKGSDIYPNEYNLYRVPKEDVEALEDDFLTPAERSRYPSPTVEEITPPYTSPLCPHLDEEYPEFRRPLKNLCPDCEKDLCPEGVCPIKPCMTDRLI